MARMIRYELKKLLAFPLWAAVVVAGVLLLAAGVGRYGSFRMQYGQSPRQFRAVSMQYAGALDQALADKALTDWRALPDQIWYGDDFNPQVIARYKILTELEREYAAAAAQADTAQGISWDAQRRVQDAAAQWGYTMAQRQHGYYEGWRTLLAAYDTEGMLLCAALVIFGLAGLFSGEQAATMAGLMRTTRYGVSAQIVSKLGAAGLYALGCVLLCALVPLGVSAMCFGLGGGALPAAYIGDAAYPMSLMGYAALRVLQLLLGALSLAAVTALCSAAMPSTTAPAMAAMAVFAAPMIYALLNTQSSWVTSLMAYMPGRLLLPGKLLSQLTPVMLWQEPLWQAQWLALVWAGLIPLLGWGAGVLYRRTVRVEHAIQE